MNEQLIVKNFGPIKDATVDFKRVTVFIGPTGGGKSTLAKLAAVFRKRAFTWHDVSERTQLFKTYSIDNYSSSETSFEWKDKEAELKFDARLDFDKTPKIESLATRFVDVIEGRSEPTAEFLNKIKAYREAINNVEITSNTDAKLLSVALLEGLLDHFVLNEPQYIPSERIFVSSIEYSWSGLMRDNIGLPKTLLDFSNSFSLARKSVTNLDIHFLNVKYLHRSGQDFIKVPGVETLFRLYETASGIQSVTPLLVLLEHLTHNTEQAQSFIIEEPELNLYPTAQQGLLNWLVEKCTQGENDLTITTHSPYILSSCNLLLEAYKVAQQRPDLEAEIAAIVPKACWLNPAEFAAYYVADGTVKPITDERTHLIGGNELDSVSGDISDSFRQLLRLKKQPA